MARQIHSVDGEPLCEKRRQRPEIFELGTDGMQEDQRWTIARYRVADAKLVGDFQKRRFNGDAFAVSLYIDHVVILQVSLLREAS